RLDRTQRTQIAAIDELRDASEDERAIALPRAAAELSPELEAVLVGSLVRGDDLEGVLLKPTAVLDDRGADRGPPRRGTAGASDDDAADRGSGWDAIDRALAPIYGDTEPLHYGTVRPYGFGGDDPIPGISAFARVDPAPHWHFVTYGFTELFRKESDDPEESGYGFELTLRLARAADDAQPPTWALNFLQNLARYVFSTGNAFAAGHKMGLNGPIALDHDTQITAVCFADDPELGEIESQLGKARFVQIVGITDDEYRVIQEWSTGGLIDILGQRIPFLLTDLARRSVLDDPATAALVRERIDREGSSEDLTFAGELVFSAEHGQLRIELGALYAATLPRAMRGRTRHGREYELRGRDAALRIVPRESPGYRIEGRDLVLELTRELAAEIDAALRDNLAGTYHFAAWPDLTIVVTPSIIRGQDGSATDVRGVVDPEAIQRILEEDHVRRAAAATHGDAADDDGGLDDDRLTADADADADADDDSDDDPDDDSDDGSAELDHEDAVPDPRRIAAALAMTARGLRLAPGDADVQLTHAMLLIDADRAGDPARADELFAWLTGFAPEVRIRAALRLAGISHPRFAEAVELVLASALPAQIVGGATTRVGSGGAAIASFGDVTQEVLEQLGRAILARAPEKLGKLVMH
ncbi:MAG: suppressor of fused domain protein, partial [bacterium]